MPGLWPRYNTDGRAHRQSDQAAPGSAVPSGPGCSLLHCPECGLGLRADTLLAGCMPHPKFPVPVERSGSTALSLVQPGTGIGPRGGIYL